MADVVITPLVGDLSKLVGANSPDLHPEESFEFCKKKEIFGTTNFFNGSMIYSCLGIIQLLIGRLF